MPEGQPVLGLQGSKLVGGALESNFGAEINGSFGQNPAAEGDFTLRAAVDPSAASGTYWGPSRLFELNGPPKPAKIPRHAQDAAA